MEMLTIYTDAAITTFVPFRFSSFLGVVDRFRWCYLGEETERVAKQWKSKDLCVRVGDPFFRREF